MARKLPKMLHRQFTAEGKASQSLKDCDMIDSLAQANGLTLPLLTAQRQLLAHLVAAGRGGDDGSAVLDMLTLESVP